MNISIRPAPTGNRGIGLANASAPPGGLTACATWLCLLLAACASSGTGSSTGIAEVARELPRHSLVLLGEVHDNPHHHRLRFESLKMAVEGGYRPALLMEQFDRERQPEIDRARREKPRDAAHLIEQVAPKPMRPGGAGWNWSFYQPFVQLALDYDLPLIAANASRADLMRVSRESVGSLFSPAERARLGLDRPVAADLQAAQEREIATSHCNALPATALGPMARAQVARDAFMALKLVENAQRGAVLIAGNGHVRTDIGAPRWLPPGQGFSVGYLETSATPTDGGRRYELTVVTAAATRSDLCEAFIKSRAEPGKS